MCWFLIPTTVGRGTREFRAKSEELKPPPPQLLCWLWLEREKTDRMWLYGGGLYFAKTDSAKSENLYRNVVNRTLPNQETDKPYSAKSYSGIC